MIKARSWNKTLAMTLVFLGLYIAALMMRSYAVAIGVIVFAVFSLGVYLIGKADWGNYPSQHKMGR